MMEGIDKTLLSKSRLPLEGKLALIIQIERVAHRGKPASKTVQKETERARIGNNQNQQTKKPEERMLWRTFMLVVGGRLLFEDAADVAVVQ